MATEFDLEALETSALNKMRTLRTKFCLQKSYLVVKPQTGSESFNQSLTCEGDFLAGWDSFEAALKVLVCLYSHVQFTCVRRDFDRPTQGRQLSTLLGTQSAWPAEEKQMRLPEATK